MFEDQCGVVTRAQALANGFSAGAIKAHLRSGRWQPLARSVYVTFSGPVPHECMRWAAILRAGPAAMLSHESAGALVGLVDTVEAPIHVTVATGRRLVRLPGVVVHQSCRTAAARHPTRLPPQTRVEETVVDLTQAASSVDRALGWVIRACARRLTTPGRIAVAVSARKKVRWRAELDACLADVAAGAHSALERRYLRDVERAHGLPPGSRQQLRVDRGRRCYDDVRYPGLVVELDGRLAHPDEARWRDMRRDNAAVLTGRRVLRYGWADVADRPCDVAVQVATVLGVRVRRCGRACAVPPP